MQPINPWLKAALEYGPLLLFLGLYWRMSGQTVTWHGTEYSGFILATAVFVPVAIVATLIQWRLTGHLSAMQAMTIVLLAVFGGLSVWLNDPRFFKAKPTIIYLLFAGILGLGLLLRRNWLQLVMSEAIPMQAAGWRILTRRLIVLFIALAGLNEIVWRTMSEATWVNYKVFGMTLILLVFFISQSGLFRRYALPEGSDRPG